MAVVFEAKILVDDNESWYIELKDTVDGRVVHCQDIEDLEKKVEELGADYGGHVDEVRWMKADDVLPHIMDEIRVQMAEARAKIEEDSGEPLTPMAEEVEA
jgi:DNA-directed RNA polymerase subunit F